MTDHAPKSEDARTKSNEIIFTSNCKTVHVQFGPSVLLLGQLDPLALQYKSLLFNIFIAVDHTSYRK